VSESAGAQARLYAHVESILNGAAFRKRDRADLAEELYGHLWQRWQDALASGLDEEAAADQAIRSFGRPARLSRDVTLAYHSRLYASTIGVLLPTVVVPREKPRAYWTFWLIHFATFFAITSLGVRTLMEWTPVRAGIGIAGCLLAYLAVLAAFGAYGARQRWALGFARFELPFLFWWGALLAWSGMPAEQLQASVVGLLVGFLVMAIAQSPTRADQSPGRPALVRLALSFVPRDWRLRSLSAWMYDRPIPRGLLVGLSGMLIVGSALTFVALNVADPTQIGPADMQVQLSVACTQSASGDVSAVDVTASFLFKRADLLPNGLSRAVSGGGPTDQIALAVEGARPNGIPMITPQLTQAATGRDITDGSPLTFGSTGQDGRSVMALPDSASFKAGHRYEVTWNYAVAPGLRDITPVVFGYDHLERFYLQAKASCGETGTAQRVSQLYVIGP
jgi:uncharacterized membrane protein YhaH (DUF805 family)